MTSPLRSPSTGTPLHPYRYLEQLPEPDGSEVQEWADSVDGLLEAGGAGRARRVLLHVLGRARALGIDVPGPGITDYLNTIPVADEPSYPGDEAMERRIRHYIRWNAAVMVARANRRTDGLGGHLATYASAATLYEVGFNHFFRGKDDGPGDQVFIQGHASPGIYARAFLEGRLNETDLDGFRREVAGGLPSYPHPRRSDFWEFPTVSMGLGLINAAYQARFNRYLHAMGIVDTHDATVWCFAGDGEMDEPESLAAVALAGREKLDNLVFVVNCNLQRLDGPVRGNGKVIQELEGLFRGAGWNVIKVVWGREWDDLLARDVGGDLVARMNTTVDGEFQKFRVETGSYIRDHFFGPEQALRDLVADLGDDDLRRLRRGGHDPRKVHAAYRAAVDHHGAPTVILAKTVKGWALGPDFEARNATHQMKKMSEAELTTFRDRLELPISDAALASDLPPYVHPGFASEEYEYLMACRRRLGGALPRRLGHARPLALRTDPYSELFAGSGDKVAVSTTSAFTRLLRNLMRDPDIGRRVVPIIPDEARTFGIDALFRQFGIYAPTGQRYEPVDADLLLSYHEATDGQVLEEGITEAGSMASLIAASTAYATWGEPMIPFFVFYSMFGLHRAGDLVWAMGDMRGRGFLLAATAGRTTLQGEGLQHCDGHSLAWASVVPNCRAYDPAFAYELAVIVRDGMQRMYGDDPEDLIYYLTAYNEAYPMPPMPDGVEDGIIRGLYRFRAAPARTTHTAQILASGTAMLAALDAQRMLADDHDVGADVWSATSFQQLRNDALDAERWNRLHPTEPSRRSYLETALAEVDGPVVAVTDFVKAVPDQIARWVPQPFEVLGTDGFGLSDTRAELRRHFEVDAPHIVVATLHGLAQRGDLKPKTVADAIADYGIDTDATDPRQV
ncbi:MAG: pyruvate dehydrogenase (acetyl-transferring), homodimeric type [Microbacteriaceae bacterium]